MARRRPNRQLAGLLAEADWTAGALARAVNALGTKYGLRLRYDRTAVAHWLEGSRPRPPVPGLVAQVLGRRLGRVVPVGETGLAPEGEDAGAAALTHGDPVERLAALCRADADPQRRLALNREMFAAAEPRLPDWPAPQPPDGDRPGERARGGAAEDDVRLADMVAIFTELTEKYGGAHARSALGSYLVDDVSQRLLTAADREADAAPLLRGGARLTHLLGAMAVDAGLPNLGYHCYRSALDLAHRAGDRDGYAITLRTMAVLAVLLDDLPHARRWAQRALEDAGATAPPAVRSYLHAGRALVRAVDGERGAALADLLAAERHHDAVADHDGSGPFRRYPRGAFLFQRGDVLLRLGDRPRAVAAFRESLAERPPQHHIAHVLTRARLTEALLVAGEVEAALSECQRALEHYPFTSSRRTTTALAGLRRSLAPYHRHPRARALRERITDLTRGPTQPSP